MANVMSRAYPVGSPQALVMEVATKVDSRFEQPVPYRYTRMSCCAPVMRAVLYLVSQVHGVWPVPAGWVTSYRASRGYAPPLDAAADHLMFLVESHPLRTSRDEREQATRLCELVMSPTGVWSLVRVHA